MMKRQRRKAAAVILAGLLTVICSLEMTSTVFAAEPDLKLTIEEVSTTDGKAVPGVEFSVFQVAAMDDKGNYSLTKDFADSGIKVYNLENAEAQLEAAKKTEIYIKEKNIGPAQHGVTGDNGELVINGLNKGLYLVLHTGTPGTKLIVKSEPFFVSLPMFETASNSWIYEVTAQPKVTTKEPETESETNPSQPETNPSQPETNPSESETTPGGGGNNGGGGGGGGNHGGGGGSNGGGGGTTTIEDTPTPLASFPQVPAEPELITIEDGPVPLAGLPMIPKLGDMGATGYLAGLLISLAACAAALKKQRDYSAKESGR